MILIPNFSKKHAAAIVLGVAAITTSVLAVQNKDRANAPAQAASEPAVTVEGYQKQVSAAFQGSDLADAASVARVLDRLASVIVPAPHMQTHFALVSGLTLYHQALAANDAAGAAAAFDELKALARSNDWIGIVTND